MAHSVNMSSQQQNQQQQQQKDSVPRDSKLMELLLKTAGVDEYEPKCAQQLLEFAHSKKKRIFLID